MGQRTLEGGKGGGSIWNIIKKISNKIKCKKKNLRMKSNEQWGYKMYQKCLLLNSNSDWNSWCWKYGCPLTEIKKIIDEKRY